MNKLIVISGCSGGGKSTLIAELEKRGYAVVPEIATKILREQTASDDEITPWNQPKQFCKLLIEQSVDTYHTAKHMHANKNMVFLDRSILDGVRYFKIIEQEHPDLYDYLLRDLRYHSEVLMAPPWEEIYESNHERKHSFETAARDYESLLAFYKLQGYSVKLIPKTTLDQRAIFALSGL